MLPQVHCECKSVISSIATKKPSVEQPTPLSKVFPQIGQFPSIAVLQLHQLFQCSSDEFPLSPTETHITCCTIGDGGNTVSSCISYSKDYCRHRRRENPRDSNQLRIFLPILRLPTSTLLCSLLPSSVSSVTTRPLQPWIFHGTRAICSLAVSMAMCVCGLFKSERVS